MKLRTNFVSNSSSSSFIVKKEDDTPGIFKENADLLDFGDFKEKVLFRAVFEPFENAEYSWYGGSNYWSGPNNFNIRNVVMTVPDEKFVDMFVGNSYKQFILPENCSKYVDELCDRITSCRAIGNERAPMLYENGKLSKTLEERWAKDRWRRLDDERARLREIYESICKKIADMLKPIMGNWEFYKTELSDEGSDAEQLGYAALENNNITWHWTFNNH